jgi:radical SAM superfamily enzyme YgiQ (UPF0313 family)
MIDILLVHTNSSAQTFQSLLKYAAIEPPIWAALLANSMRGLGVRVDILDCEALQLSTKESYNHIRDINPTLVCFVQFGQHPSASAQSMQGTHELLEIMDYEFKTILVGLYPSALPRKTLEDEKCDFVCEGEGVDTLLGLFQSDLVNVSKVPRLWYRDRDEIKFTHMTPIIDNLEQGLPGMAWDLLPMEKYRTEFDKIADMGIRNIKIADEMFVLNKNHFLKVCDLIIERGYDFNIWAYARVDTVREEYLEKLKKAGVNWLALGIESGNRKIRVDAVKGKFQEVDIVDIVRKIESFEIEALGNYMFGMSGDTFETMQQTLDLASLYKIL